jgi:hypothetical protein
MGNTIINFYKNNFYSDEHFPEIFCSEKVNKISKKTEELVIHEYTCGLKEYKKEYGVFNYNLNNINYEKKYFEKVYYRKNKYQCKNVKKKKKIYFILIIFKIINIIKLMMLLLI